MHLKQTSVQSENRRGTPMLRVLICDELSVVRDGLRARLVVEPVIDVVATTDSGTQALVQARSHRPDVVVTGLALRGMRGIDLISSISRGEGGNPPPRVVVFTMSDDPEAVTGILRADVSGLLVNDTSQQELGAAVRAAAKGHTMVSPLVTHHLVDWFRKWGGRPGRENAAVVSMLTSKELQVLGLIARGMSPEDVANELVISLATVRTHVYRLRTKLEVKDRAQLVALAYRTGLVQPG